MVKCAWPGCEATTETPTMDLWAHLSDYPPPICDGLYCPEHATEIEAELFDMGIGIKAAKDN
jgi:hypothetical protein